MEEEEGYEADFVDPTQAGVNDFRSPPPFTTIWLPFDQRYCRRSSSSLAPLKFWQAYSGWGGRVPFLQSVLVRLAA